MIEIDIRLGAYDLIVTDNLHLACITKSWIVLDVIDFVEKKTGQNAEYIVSEEHQLGHIDQAGETEYNRIQEFFQALDGLDQLQDPRDAEESEDFDQIRHVRQVVLVADFLKHEVDDADHHDQEIKLVPAVVDVVAEAQRVDFDHGFQNENDRANQVQNIQHL